MGDYISVSKPEAMKLLEDRQYLVGTTFTERSSQKDFKADFLMLLPANPEKYRELANLIISLAAKQDNVTIEDVQQCADNYMGDKFTVGLFGTAFVEIEPGTYQVGFLCLTLQYVVDQKGELSLEFAL